MQGQENFEETQKFEAGHGDRQAFQDLDVLNLLKQQPPSQSDRNSSNPGGRSGNQDVERLGFKGAGQLLAAAEGQPVKQWDAGVSAPAEKELLQRSQYRTDVPKTGFSDSHFYDHTARFDNALKQYAKDGWTPEVQKAMTDLCLDEIKCASKLGQFGTTRSQWQDIRSAMRMANHEGKFDEFIKSINEGLKDDANTKGLQVEVQRKEGYKPLIGSYKDGETIVQMKGGKDGQWQMQLQMFSDKNFQQKR